MTLDVSVEIPHHHNILQAKIQDFGFLDANFHCQSIGASVKKTVDKEKLYFICVLFYAKLTTGIIQRV